MSFRRDLRKLDGFGRAPPHSIRFLWYGGCKRPTLPSRARPDSQNFDKVINCRKPALGAEVYASETETKLVPHTCKSRVCPSCGQQATGLWQWEQEAALPDIPYAGVVLTMPDVLWPIFRRNRLLLPDLAALGVAAIQQWAKASYGVRVFMVVVQQTFGGRLNFNPHLHILVFGGGLEESECRWVAPLHFDKEELMELWRFAVISYLWRVLKARLVKSGFEL